MQERAKTNILTNKIHTLFLVNTDKAQKTANYIAELSSGFKAHIRVWTRLERKPRSLLAQAHYDPDNHYAAWTQRSTQEARTPTKEKSQDTHKRWMSWLSKGGCPGFPSLLASTKGGCPGFMAFHWLYEKWVSWLSSLRKVGVLAFLAFSKSGCPGFTRKVGVLAFRGENRRCPHLTAPAPVYANVSFQMIESPGDSALMGCSCGVRMP